MSSTPQPQLTGDLFDLPTLGLALLDDDSRVSWVNHRLAELVESEPPALMGRSPDELPDKASKVLFGQPPLMNLLTQDKQLWLRREIHTRGNQALIVFHDVTEQQSLSQENQRLRQKVQDLKLNDDLTGLPNKRAISHALDLQISRSRRYQNPLSVVMVHLGLSDQQIAGLHGVMNPLVLSVSRYLRDRLRWVDQIGRWDENIFVLVLPETGKEETDGLVEKIRDEQANMELPAPFDEVHPSLSFGTAYWQKGDDLRTLLRRATAQLADE